MMKKLILILLVLLISYENIYAKSLLFQCENKFSYKIEYYNKQSHLFFRELNKDWRKVEKANMSENKYELFLPDSSYLGCTDKSLAICRFSTLIIYKPASGEANVREVISNDCFIGTMGCNKYNKGSELNLRRCTVYNLESSK